MKCLITPIQCIILVCLLSYAYGGTITVPGEQPTIQAGIHAAVAGDTVMVAAGTYTENLVLKSGVVVQGPGADQATIHGTGLGAVVTAVNVDEYAKIDGFTITGGTADGGSGIACQNASPTISNNVITGNRIGIGCYVTSFPEISNNVITDNSSSGIGCSVYSDPLIIDNVITNNTPTYGGGGISCGIYSHPWIVNNIIKGNSSVSGSGGGIGCYRSSPMIMNNAIVNNSAAYMGGGIDSVFYSHPLIMDNKIIGNSAQYGGGIASFVSGPRVFNNAIISNSAFEGGGIYALYTTTTITNCIIWGNGDDLSGCTASYSCIEDGDPGECNISAKPLFVDAPNGDYRLQALSPCIDAGKNLTDLPSSDLLGNPRIVDGDNDGTPTVDIGPCEYIPAINVVIDIKPGSAANPVNLSSRGILPVALITTDDFDAWTADVETVTFGPNAASPVHVSSEDVDGDGDLDLVFHFRQQEIGFTAGDISGLLEGCTNDNFRFSGKDTITVVPKKKGEVRGRLIQASPFWLPIYAGSFASQSQDPVIENIARVGNHRSLNALNVYGYSKRAPFYR